MKCKNCGKDLNENAKFCRYCGTQVQKETMPPDEELEFLLCVKCGTKNSKKAKYCKICGVPIIDASDQKTEPIKKTANEHKIVRDEIKPAEKINVKEEPESTETYDKDAALNQGTANEYKIIKDEKKIPENNEIRFGKKNNKSKEKNMSLKNVKPKKPINKRLMRRSIALITAVVLIGTVLWQVLKQDTPDNPNHKEEISSSDETKYTYSPLVDITYSSAEMNTTGVKAVVSPDSPKVTLSGVTVDFGDYNIAESGTLEIAKLPVKSDSGAGIQAQAYNISLGDIEKFPAMVEITIPYDTQGLSEEEENYAISVGWYDENQNIWKILPSQVNSSSNTVTFKTDHFSPFAILKNTMTKGNTVFYYENNQYLGPNTPVLVDTGALKKYLNSIDSNSFDKLIRDKSVPTNELLSSGLGIFNDVMSGSDYAVALSQSSSLMKIVGSKFTALGAAALAYKVTDQWSRGVKTDKIIRDNAFSLLELAATGVVIATGSPFVTVCAAGIWIAGIVDNLTYDPEDIGVYLNYLERCYDYFNLQQATYMSSTGQCSYNIQLPGKRSNLRSGERFLTAKSDWGAVVSGIYYDDKKYPNLISSDVNKLLDSYSDVFWNVPRSDLLYWIDQSGLLPAGTYAKDLPWPTDPAEIQKYKDRCKIRNFDRLQPLFKAMAEKELRDLWMQYYAAAFQLADELNQTMVFEVNDPALKTTGFSKSKYANKVLYLNNNGLYGNDFYCKERHTDSNQIFTCTVYHYITAGMPNELMIFPEGADQYTLADQIIPFTPDLPKTIIELPEKISTIQFDNQETVYLKIPDMTYASVDQSFTIYYSNDYPDSTIEWDMGDGTQYSYPAKHDTNVGGNMLQTGIIHPFTSAGQFTVTVKWYTADKKLIGECKKTVVIEKVKLTYIDPGVIPEGD